MGMARIARSLSCSSYVAVRRSGVLISFYEFTFRELDHKSVAGSTDELQQRRKLISTNALQGDSPDGWEPARRLDGMDAPSIYMASEKSPPHLRQLASIGQMRVGLRFDFIVEDRELFRAAEARGRPRFKPFMTLMFRIITIKIHQVFNVPVER